jgi:hypothetical protein
MSERRDNFPSWLGHLMCRFGMHDFQLIASGSCNSEENTKLVAV